MLAKLVAEGKVRQIGLSNGDGVGTRTTLFERGQRYEKPAPRLSRRLSYAGEGCRARSRAIEPRLGATSLAHDIPVEKEPFFAQKLGEAALSFHA